MYSQPVGSSSPTTRGCYMHAGSLVKRLSSGSVVDYFVQKVLYFFSIHMARNDRGDWKIQLLRPRYVTKFTTWTAQQ